MINWVATILGLGGIAALAWAASVVLRPFRAPQASMPTARWARAIPGLRGQQATARLAAALREGNPKALGALRRAVPAAVAGVVLVGVALAMRALQ